MRLRTAMDQEYDNARDTRWLRAQLEDLADHVANAQRPSKARTAEAIRNIAMGKEWRLGRWP